MRYLFLNSIIIKMNRETYLFHQTPEELCKELIKFVPYEENDILLEPFKGEGNFYRNFPTTTINEWCELVAVELEDAVVIQTW
jgi:hypothetical protein